MNSIISFYLLLLICVATSHANASQEAQLRKYILSRRSTRGSGNSRSSVEATLTSESLVTASLPKGYSGSDQTSQKEADKIAVLPGQPKGVNFDQYGGYVTVDEKNGRELFYYFVEAPYGASAKPLVLWLNGGPGCSSLGYGAMQELGPFRVNSDNKTLSRNKHAWNNVANVLFLESPAGVGFSFSNTTSDYNESGDARTAEDAYVFLINWLERFPEHKTRPFYISGESYAGHYVPQLAATILSHNIFFNKTIINLQGILVGNPYLDDNKNSKGQIDYLWSHGLVSDEVFANITTHCNFSSSDGKSCFDAWNAIDLGQIDPYNIYAPICLDTPNGKYYSSSFLPGYDPCNDYYVHAYLNDITVQKAFHARINTKWSGCADLPAWNDAPESTVPTIKWLVEHGLTVWLFSGDFDVVCPLPATRYSVNDLNLPVTKPWRPWTTNKEVGGYVQKYNGGFVLFSVRGAGHMVPSFQPERALMLLYSFLKGMLPPYVPEQ